MYKNNNTFKILSTNVSRIQQWNYSITTNKYQIELIVFLSDKMGTNFLKVLKIGNTYLTEFFWRVYNLNNFSFWVENLRSTLSSDELFWLCFFFSFLFIKLLILSYSIIEFESFEYLFLREPALNYKCIHYWS